MKPEELKERIIRAANAKIRAWADSKDDAYRKAARELLHAKHTVELLYETDKRTFDLVYGELGGMTDTAVVRELLNMERRQAQA